MPSWLSLQQSARRSARNCATSSPRAAIRSFGDGQHENRRNSLTEHLAAIIRGGGRTLDRSSRVTPRPRRRYPHESEHHRPDGHRPDSRPLAHCAIASGDACSLRQSHRRCGVRAPRDAIERLRSSDIAVVLTENRLHVSATTLRTYFSRVAGDASRPPRRAPRRHREPSALLRVSPHPSDILRRLHRYRSNNRHDDARESAQRHHPLSRYGPSAMADMKIIEIV